MEDSPSQQRQSEDKTWAIACHVAALSVYVGVPFGNILGPLVVWLIKRDEMRLVDSHGREAINFNISVAIYGLICLPLVLVIIGIPLLILLTLFHLICIIFAIVRLSNGEHYTYPLTIRFL